MSETIALPSCSLSLTPVGFISVFIFISPVAWVGEERRKEERGMKKLDKKSAVSGRVISIEYLNPWSSALHLNMNML